MKTGDRITITLSRSQARFWRALCREIKAGVPNKHAAMAAATMYGKLDEKLKAAERGLQGTMWEE